MLRLKINEQQRLRIAISPRRWGAGRDAYASLRDVVVTRRTKGKRVLNYYISLRGESLTIRRGAGLMRIITCHLQGANNMTKCRFIHSFIHALIVGQGALQSAPAAGDELHWCNDWNENGHPPLAIASSCSV